jgi:hypothetical protein
VLQPAAKPPAPAKVPEPAAFTAAAAPQLPQPPAPAVTPAPLAVLEEQLAQLTTRAEALAGGGETAPASEVAKLREALTAAATKVARERLAANGLEVLGPVTVDAKTQELVTGLRALEAKLAQPPVPAGLETL